MRQQNSWTVNDIFIVSKSTVWWNQNDCETNNCREMDVLEQLLRSLNNPMITASLTYSNHFFSAYDTAVELQVILFMCCADLFHVYLISTSYQCYYSFRPDQWTINKKNWCVETKREKSNGLCIIFQTYDLSRRHNIFYGSAVAI